MLAPPPPQGLEPSAPPSFSIVIAAYNAAETIADALDSALRQTVPAADVAVCDDGSTDDLAGAIAPYVDRILLVQQENAGEGAAKNAGVRASSGEFAVFLDADDVFLPTRLEALGELAAGRPDLDILTTDALVEVDGEVVRRCYEDSWPFAVGDQRAAILERNFVFGLAAVRRTAFVKAGGFDETLRFATDWDLWCRMILSGSRAGLVAEPLARYRLASASLSAQRPALLRGRCAVVERALARTDLSADDRQRAARTLAANRRAALVAEAHEALLAGASDARTLALQVAFAPAMGGRTRLKALAAAAAPRAASRALAAARERAGVPGPAGLQFPP